jgi:low affinity Fe/Cu permease
MPRPLSACQLWIPVGDPIEHSTSQQRVSRILHWVGDVTARASATVVVTLVLVIYGVVLGVKGFPGRWQTGFSTAVEAVTLVMLFVIQHTQSRQQLVTQLKLDELIRSSPHADDLLVHLEVADDTELIEREQSQLAHHEAVRELDDDEE